MTLPPRGDSSGNTADGGISAPLLRVSNLTVEFSGDHGVTRAVDGISFSLERGSCLGIVGESGSGKSATSLAIMRLMPPRGRISGGKVELHGEDLLALSEEEMRHVRGRRIAMIFQDPMTSLNPYLTIADQLTEPPMLHLGASRRDAEARGIALLDRVGIPDAAMRMKSYPHELSGGMRQRVMIAMALAGDPELLIADEPTTALDVTIQAEILELLGELVRERGLGVILITHDLGVVATLSRHIAVVYAGRVVEMAPTTALFRSPAHPYTKALMRSLPEIDGPKRRRLDAIGGMPPRLDRGPFRECAFAPRCALEHAACHQGEPRLELVAPDHARRCVLPPEAIR